MAQVSGAPVFPLPKGLLYARAYVKEPTALGTGSGQLSGHVIWIEVIVANDVTESRWGANIGQIDVNHWPGDQEQRAPNAAFPANAWNCVEIMYDSTHQLVKVWMNSTEITDLDVTNWVAPMQANGNNTTPLTNWSPDYEAIRFGWELGGASIWYDDVVLSYSPIGCVQ